MRPLSARRAHIVVDMDLGSIDVPERETDEEIEADLCDRLLGCAELLLGDLAERASDAGLARPELLALRELVRHGAPMRPYQLAGALGCSRPNVTKIIQRLVEAAYVSEELLWLSPYKKTLSVTPQGHEAYTHSMRTADRAHPLRALDARQRQQLRRLLAVVQLAWRSSSRGELLAPARAVNEVNHFRQRKRLSR